MFNSLQSFRGFFAIMVFLSHAVVDDHNGRIFHEGGPAGVQFFFMLSGFVLCAAYHGQLTEHRFDYGNYLRRRFVRIFPVHWLALAYCVALLLIFSLPDAGALAANFFAVQAWTPTYEYGLNVPSWALGPILFFYLLFPILFMWQARHKVSFRLFCAVGAAVLLGLTVFQPVAPDGDFPTHNEAWINRLFPPVRLLDFCVGMLVWECYVRMKDRRFDCRHKTAAEVCVVALWIVTAVLSVHVAQKWQTQFLWAIPTAMLILTFALFNEEGGKVSRFMQLRPLVYFGNISMVFYLFHIACSTTWYILLYKFIIPGEPVNHALIIGTALVLSLIASVAVTHLFDRPIGNYLRRRMGVGVKHVYVNTLKK